MIPVDYNKAIVSSTTEADF